MKNGTMAKGLTMASKVTSGLKSMGPLCKKRVATFVQRVHRISYRGHAIPYSWHVPFLATAQHWPVAADSLAAPTPA